MRRLVPESSVLIVIDVQERLMSAMPADRTTQVLRGIDILLVAAAQLEVPVLATEQYPQGLGPTVPSVARGLAAREVKPLEKVTFSALGAPAFLDRLGLLSARSAIVVGVETHVCVFQTARQLVERGLEVHVPIDAVASRREDHRDAGLALCERAGAIRTTCETVVFDWLERAGSEAFRAISKVVR